MVKQVSNLTNNQAIFKGEQVIAFFTSDTQERVDFDSYEQVEFKEEVHSNKKHLGYFFFKRQSNSSRF